MWCSNADRWQLHMSCGYEATEVYSLLMLNAGMALQLTALLACALLKSRSLTVSDNPCSRLHAKPTCSQKQ